MSLQTVFEGDVAKVTKQILVGSEGAPVEDSELANKEYVDDTVNSIEHWLRDGGSATIYPRVPGDKMAGGLTVGGSFTIESTLDATKGPISILADDVSVSGNFSMPASTASVGVIKTSGGDSFLHNFGGNSVYLGRTAGNFTLSGTENVGIGQNVLVNLTSGSSNTCVGEGSMLNLTTGVANTCVGRGSMQNAIAPANTVAIGASALNALISGTRNTACGSSSNSTTTGTQNTSCGAFAMATNTTGSQNTCLGDSANVGASGLSNAMALGFNTSVSASNKVRIGNGSITVIEGEVDFTFSSSKYKKEGFRSVNGELVLEKLKNIPVTSWNYKNHDPTKFRHYGMMAQDFHEQFGKDEIGTIGTDTTLTGSDVSGILLSAIKALEERSQKQQETIEELRKLIVV